jgi:hypothetical protein
MPLVEICRERREERKMNETTNKLLHLIIEIAFLVNFWIRRSVDGWRDEMNYQSAILDRTSTWNSAELLRNPTRYLMLSRNVYTLRSGPATPYTMFVERK